MKRESFSELVDASLQTARGCAVALLPACLVYDGIGPLLVEWALPVGDSEIAPLRLWVSLFLSSVFGLLGSYAVAYGLWQSALGRVPSPGEVVMAPWRESTWSIPMAFSFAVLISVGFFLGFLPAIVAQIFLITAGPVAAVEHLGGYGTLRRAWTLGVDHRMRAAGIFGIVAMGLIASGLPAALVEAEATGPVQVVTALLHAAVALFGDTAAFLLYADLRVRKEGFDPAGASAEAEPGVAP